MDFDDILFMSKKVNDGIVDFVSLLEEFNTNNSNNLSSFNAYVTDNHRGYIFMNEDDINHIFSELMQNIESN